MATTIRSYKTRTESMLPNKRFFSLVGGALVLFHAYVFECKAGEFRSGIYENVIIAMDKSGSITGRYQESQGEGVRKTCSFYFKGKAQGGVAEIITWSDRQLPGLIKAVNEGVELKVPGGREHAGCGLVLLPDIAEGLSFDLLYPTDWQKLTTIVASARLRKSITDSEERGQRLTVGTTVGVIDESGDWLLVETTGGERRARGWIRADETAEQRLP
ncbi:hypothetical protein KP003_18795 [Geomonas nitrogeniifigens]|uniref:hypothetical protein n=1 Tax=Geomonas diazotrophica TaxID=2843197 RepID=UPI001C2CAC0F|nr:hypothetical protein [Geomonas nitrogeniifigens]QXE86380.1 hypothetical protein KP003_18795 [Geomonas nitrogeniifigens]